MAVIAIDFVLEQLPRAEGKPRRRRGENKGRHISRAVRRRNQRGANPRWQPTKAFRKFKTPRTTERAAAISESLAEDPVVVVPAVVGYSECASEHETERVLEAEDEIFVEVVNHGLREQLRALRLARCPQYFEDQVALLEHEPDIYSLSTASMLEEIEASALAHLAA